MRRHRDVPADRARIDALALLAFLDDATVVPDALLAQTDGDGLGSRVAHCIGHLVARAVLELLAGDQRLLHGDVEGLTELDPDARPGRRVADAALADEFGLALRVAHIDPDQAFRHRVAGIGEA